MAIIRRIFKIRNEINKQYIKSIKINENYNYKDVFEDIKGFKYKPKVSILIPVYNVKERLLRECIESVLNQYYDNFEICIADDASTKKHIKPILDEYQKKDARIKVEYREKNGHISKASNSALELATGEYIALLDNDDIIPEFALYEVVKKLNSNKKLDMIYSDEDLISDKGKRLEPLFKPDFSPDTLMSKNYINHLGVYRTKILREIGGFRNEYVGAQDYDMVLRFTERTKNIAHIPKVLYHWRKTKGSTALDGESAKSYAFVAGKKALISALERRKIKGSVTYIKKTHHYMVDYKARENDYVSIIIPTRDYSETLEKCLASIYKKANKKNFEIIVVDNGSKEAKTKKLFKKYKITHNNFRILELNVPFNYSYLNNEAAKIAKGNLLLFLNNDIEIITENWLEKMMGYASRDHVGAVGVKLVYPENTIQHGGVMLGMLGLAGHMYINQRRDSLGVSGNLITPTNYSAVTAACLMIEKKKFNKVKGFDEKFAVAFNDVDFCLKILEKGKYNVFLPQVEMYHFESKSRGYEDTPEKKERFANEAKMLKSKWKEKLDNDRFYNDNLEKESSCSKIKC